MIGKGTEIIRKLVRKHFTKSNSYSFTETGILNKRFVTKDWENGRKENVISLLKHSNKKTNTNANTNSNSNRFWNFFRFLKTKVDDDVEEVVLPCLKDYRFLKFHGHNHGIVCLSDRFRDIFFFNPTTMEFRQLPPSILPLVEDPKFIELRINFMRDQVGFGYDPKSKDFKVVRVSYDQFCHFHDGPVRVEVYNLRSDRWREIKTHVPGKVISHPGLSCGNGMYYWQATSPRDCIQSFDMTREVFDIIPLPECIHDAPLCYNDNDILLWNGSLLLLNYPRHEGTKTFEIWELDYALSWSKLSTIGPLSGIKKPLVFVNYHELLLESYGGHLVSYNLKTKQLQRLPVRGHPGSFQAILFTETLTSLNSPLSTTT